MGRGHNKTASDGQRKTYVHIDQVPSTLVIDSKLIVQRHAALDHVIVGFTGALDADP